MSEIPTGHSSATPPTVPALRRTPLYACHLEAGAKLVDFGGWEMPLHYGSQLEEHHQVRRDAGVFDVSHMVNVDVIGPQAREFLRRLVANDVAKLAVGQALYSCMLNEDGGVIDDLIIYRLAEHGRYRVVVNAATAQSDLAWMQQVVAREGFEVSVTARTDLAMLAIQGPQVWQRLQTAFPAWAAQAQALQGFHALELGESLIARTGYTGEDGFEWVMPATEVVAAWQQLLAAGVRPIGLGARDTLRLEAGMNLYGQDMDTTVTPLSCGLAWTVDRKTDPERRFIGVEALAQPSADKAVGLKLLDRGVLRAHMALRSLGAEPDGLITSGTFSPSLGFSIAMARVPRAVTLGQTVEVDVRGKWLRALVVKMPFVRHGQAMVE